MAGHHRRTTSGQIFTKISRRLYKLYIRIVRSMELQYLALLPSPHSMCQSLRRSAIDPGQFDRIVENHQPGATAQGPNRCFRSFSGLERNQEYMRHFSMSSLEHYECVTVPTVNVQRWPAIQYKQPRLWPIGNWMFHHDNVPVGLLLQPSLLAGLDSQ